MSHFYYCEPGERPRLINEVSTPAQARKWREPLYKSVTTVLKLYPNDGLKFWFERTLVKYARENPGADQSTLIDMCWQYRTTPDGRTVKSCDFGTEVHSHLENAALCRKNGEPHFCGEWEPWVEPFRIWMEENNLLVLEAEYPTVCHDMRVCGTVDLIGEVDGRIQMWDFKTRAGNGQIKRKSYETDAAQLGIEAEMLRAEWGLDYTPRVNSVLIDTDTGETHVKRWSLEKQENGARIFRICNDLYNALYDL